MCVDAADDVSAANVIGAVEEDLPSNETLGGFHTLRRGLPFINQQPPLPTGEIPLPRRLKLTLGKRAANGLRLLQLSLSSRRSTRTN